MAVLIFIGLGKEMKRVRSGRPMGTEISIVLSVPSFLHSLAWLTLQNLKVLCAKLCLKEKLQPKHVRVWPILVLLFYCKGPVQNPILLYYFVYQYCQPLDWMFGLVYFTNQLTNQVHLKITQLTSVLITPKMWGYLIFGTNIHQVNKLHRSYIW